MDFTNASTIKHRLTDPLKYQRISEPALNSTALQPLCAIQALLPPYSISELILRGLTGKIKEGRRAALRHEPAV
jgi:hypothetical protein